MDPAFRGDIEDEIERYDALLIAAESWADGYKKDKDSYKSLIRTEAKLTRQIRTVFRETAARVDEYINWNAYYGQLNAAVDVEVIVDDSLYDNLDELFFTFTFETIATAVTVGADAGEAIYGYRVGLRTTDAIIQELTTKRLAYLVGKKVDKDGSIVDNPKSDYRISDKTRADIAKNIQTSIALGEDRNALTDRLQRIIKNPKRAELIAQTESVNAYGAGVHQYGIESGATGKEWDDVAAHDICATNRKAGVIPINDPYPSGHQHPGAHVGCRCGERIVYANEFPVK